MAAQDRADWGSILMSSISSAEEEIVLISKEGKSFRINMEIARASSPYFAGLLGNNMLEAGKLIIHSPCCSLNLKESLFRTKTLLKVF